MAESISYGNDSWFDKVCDVLKVYGLCGILQTLISLILTIVTYAQDYSTPSILYWTFYIFLMPVTVDCWNIIAKLPKGLKNHAFCAIILFTTSILTILLVGGIAMLGLKATRVIDIPDWCNCIARYALWLNSVATLAKYAGEAMIDYNRSVLSE